MVIFCEYANYWWLFACLALSSLRSSFKFSSEHDLRFDFSRNICAVSLLSGLLLRISIELGLIGDDPHGKFIYQSRRKFSIRILYETGFRFTRENDSHQEKRHWMKAIAESRHGEETGDARPDAETRRRPTAWISCHLNRAGTGRLMNNKRKLSVTWIRIPRVHWLQSFRGWLSISQVIEASL